MKMKLKLKLTLSYIAISVLLVFSLFLISYHFFQKQFQNYIVNQQQLKNKEIVEVITNAYTRDGFPPDTSFFEDFADNLLNQYLILSVYNNDDKMIFCMACMQKDSCNHTINNMKQMMKDIYPNFKGKYVEEKLDIIKNGQNLGYIKIGFFGPFFYSESDQAFIKTFNSMFLLIAIISLVVSIIVGILIANGIEKPIKKVIKKTKEISNGDYSGKIDVKTSTTEILELANSINSLTNNLKYQLTIKKQMAGDFTHEFLTPLASIQGSIEAIIDGVFEATPKRLEGIKNEVERLARMVFDIEKIVSNTDKNINLVKSEFNVSNIIENSIKIFEVELYTKKIKLHFNKKNIKLFADKDKISQVMVNLISNAIKYTDNNGNLTINATQENFNVKIEVIDNGCGIEAENLKYIFEYLYRTDKSRSRDTGGSGIGLYVAKSIVEAHDGNIRVESEINKGSKFIVSIPNKITQNKSSH